MKTKIKFNEVTWYSKLAAVILFVITFAVAFCLGQQYGSIPNNHILTMQWSNSGMMNRGTINQPINTTKQVAFACANKKIIDVTFRNEIASLILSDGRTMNLLLTISASGARYANTDESFVFWNKGNTAFITEGLGKNLKTTFTDCVATL